MTAKQKKNFNPAASQISSSAKQSGNYIYLIIILASVFCLMLFKNIAYPLLWNDESETVMNGKRILEYGYPKMNDGKNNIFLPLDSTWTGYKKEYDANITIPWGSYYFAAIGVLIADHVDDIYSKTAIIRITFALAGLLGLIIFILSLKDFFANPVTFQKCLLAFIIIELFSVPLLLHLREARYYSLVILTVACFFYVFTHYFLHKTYSLKKYLFLMTTMLFMCYQVNVASFLACCLALGLYAIFDLFYERNSSEPWRWIRTRLINITPVFISLILLIPFFIFFETFSISEKVALGTGYDFDMFSDHLKRIVYILRTQDLLYAALMAKALYIMVWFRKKKEKAVHQWSLDKFSFFASLFCICYCLVIARIPSPLMWTRYFIVLQPILVFILLIDTISIFKYISDSVNSKAKPLYRIAVSTMLVIACSVSALGKIEYVKEYAYQLTHPLKGPLDLIIPAIKKNCPRTDTLIIATNYEELSYIYYLDCKVTMGFENKIYAQDIHIQPDLIAFRKSWGHNPAPYRELIQRARYKRLAFPVYDSQTNNIAELDFTLQHQFRTRLPANENEMADIYIRMPD